MKTTMLITAVTISTLLSGCASWKKTLSSEGCSNVAVKNVIEDFIHTSRLSRVEDIFNITIQDINHGVIIISIGGAVNKIYPQTNNKIGTYDEYFPTQFLIKDGKLFYWNDPNTAISESVLTILQEYEHINFDWEKEYGFPPIAIDDAKEGMVYYICKNNLINYKKTGANTIYKRYKTPEIKCDL